MCLRNTIARLPNAVDSITLIRIGATALVELTALVVLTAPVEVLTAPEVLTALVMGTALGPMGARRRDLVWLTRHIMQSHAR